MGTNTSSPAQSWRVARFGVFEVDAAAGELRKSGMRLKLQDQPFQILMMLLGTPGEIVTRDAMQSALWPADTFVEFDHSLNTAVKKLRQALGDDADNPRFVETIPRRGYRFIAPVQFQPDGGASFETLPVSSTLSAESNPVLTLHKHHLLWIGVSVAVALLVMVALLLHYAGSKQVPTTNALTITPFTWYPGDEVTPAFSPDGSRVAFAWAKKDENTVHIYVKVIGTEEPVALTSGKSLNIFPEFSPDGRFIAFRKIDDRGSGVYLMPSTGGAERLLHMTVEPTSLARLSFSPDGKQIAFADIENGRSAIFVLSMDDLSVRRVTTPLTTSGDTEPRFSPDGKQIAFIRDTKDVGNLYIVPAAGGESRAITHLNQLFVGGLEWAPDGKSVVLGGMGLKRVWVDDGRIEVLSSIGLSWAPSIRGHQIVYAASSWNESIYEVDLSRTKVEKVRPLIVSSQAEEAGQYSPDGKSVVFQSTRTRNFELYRADPDGSNQLQLTHFGGPLTGTPHWLPDGKQIVFDSRPNGNPDLYIMPANGGAPRQLTKDATNEAVPFPSHDGKWIYFASDRTGAWNIWKMPIQGGPATQLTRDGGFGPQESLDGKFVYYAKGIEQGGIWRVPVNGGKEEYVVDSPPNFWGYMALTRSGIYFIQGAKPATPWSTEQPSDLSFFDFSTGKTIHVTNLPKAPSCGSPGMGVSADGKRLLITLLENRSSDLMLADGLK